MEMQVSQRVPCVVFGAVLRIEDSNTFSLKMSWLSDHVCTKMVIVFADLGASAVVGMMYSRG